MLHDIMGKGQLYPFTVTNKQERRNMGRCKEHVEGHEKKKVLPWILSRHSLTYLHGDF